ncbi:MAG: DUF2892 domain-containing protein [Desulfobacterales bacterium]|nr:DUF2892 domain-containing protein [Desulfobacterales bacterium]
MQLKSDVHLPILVPMMKCNVGRLERIIRVIIGLGLMGAGILFNSWWGIIGLIPLLTAIIGWCPVSAAIGFSTCRDAKSTLPDTTTDDSKKPMRIRDI